MAQRKSTEKRSLKKREKKREQFYYYIFVGLTIIWIVYYALIQPETIGHDYRYNLYIFWLPTIAGILAIGFYNRKLIIETINESGTVISKILSVLFLLLMGAFWSYLSIGQLSKIVFHTINKEVAKAHAIETFRYDINQIEESSGKGSTKYNIWFKFHNRSEHIYIDRETFERYENENPKNYQIKLELQKGIWNHYLLNSWEIVKK